MTRETKIGLLVGLAFIIVVGILLSDHMASTTELPQAPLETAERTSHGAVVTPGESRNIEIAKVITPMDVTPTPVPTREEINQQREAANTTVVAPPVVVQNTQNDPKTIVTPVGTVVSELNKVANAQGHELVDVNGNPIAAQPPVVIIPPSDEPKVKPTPVVAVGPKTYVAQPGDNLNKIALKTMGASTKANRDAIVKANADLRDNPNLIVAGKSYVIPTPQVATPAPTPATDMKPQQVSVLMKQAPKPAKSTTDAPADASAMYTVKANDNLWHIAATQLGAGNKDNVQKIMDLNKDTLKGSANVRVGMKLRLPTKAA